MKYNFFIVLALGAVLTFGAAQAQFQVTESVTATSPTSSQQLQPGVSVQQDSSVQQSTEANVTSGQYQPAQITAAARPQCRANEDCRGILCPQVVGQDTPQCNLKANVCFCGPGPSVERPTALSGEVLIHPRLQAVQMENMRQPLTEAKQISSTVEELQQLTLQHQQAFTERKNVLQAEAEEKVQEAGERALSLRTEYAEEIAARKQQFEEKVRQMTEERHQQAAIRLSERVNLVNQNMTNGYFNYLNAIEIVLDKLETRTQIVGEATGFDMAAFLEEIASASIRIEDAREAVIAQKSKEYVIEIESETTLGADISATMQELRTDHASLRDNVLDPVRHLIRDLTQVLHDTVTAAGTAAAASLNL